MRTLPFASKSANAIACKFTAEELALISTIPVQLGDTLAAISAQEALLDQCKER